MTGSVKKKKKKGVKSSFDSSCKIAWLLPVLHLSQTKDYLLFTTKMKVNISPISYDSISISRGIDEYLITPYLP